MPTWCACCRRRCAAQGRADRLPRGRARRRRRSARASRSCSARASASRSSTRCPTTTCCAWAPRCADMPLVTAGSGVAIGLPAQLRHRAVDRRERAAACGAACGGACRAAARLATNRQVRALHRRAAGRRSRSIRCASRAATTWSAQALAWAAPLLARGPVLVYSTADAGRGQGGAGARSASTQAGALVERALAAIARGLVERGVRPARGRGRRDLGRRACRRWASRSCASAPQIDPGVPWCHAQRRRPAPRACTSRSSPATSAADDFFDQGVRASCDERERRPREEICRVGRACSSAATCTPPPATSACGSTTAS